MPHFVTSKLFKVIFTDFLLKKFEKFSFWEANLIFSKKNYSFAKCYGEPAMVLRYWPCAKCCECSYLQSVVYVAFFKVLWVVMSLTCCKCNIVWLTNHISCDNLGGSNFVSQGLHNLKVLGVSDISLYRFLFPKIFVKGGHYITKLPIGNGLNKGGYSHSWFEILVLDQFPQDWNVVSWDFSLSSQKSHELLIPKLEVASFYKNVQPHKLHR